MNDLYELTSPQKGIWEIEQFHQNTAIGNIGGTLLIDRRLNTEFAEKAVNKFVEKNDSMRIHLKLVDEKPMQYFSKHVDRKIKVADFSDKTKEEQEAWLKGQAKKPFSLYDTDLWEMTILLSWDKMSGFYGRFHHIISDGWTFALMAEQLMEYYDAIEGNYLIDNVVRPSYKDSIEGEIEYFSSKKYQKDKAYWNEKYSEKPELIQLKDRDPNKLTTRAGRITTVIQNEEADAIRAFCEEKSISPAVLFKTALIVYLYRFYGMNDIILGTPIYNRSGYKEKQTIGMFVSTVPLRTVVTDEDTFLDICKAIVKQQVEVFRHQKYPYGELLIDLRSKYNLNQNLYEIAFSFQNVKIEKEKIDHQFKTEWCFSGQMTDSLCIHIDERDDSRSFVMNVDFLSDLFTKEEAQDIQKRVLLLLNQGIRNCDKNIKEYELIDEAERVQILFDFNDTYTDYPRDKCIHELFEEQVERTPDRVAVIDQFGEHTYSDINRKSNVLANELRKHGVTNGSVVGIMTRRSADLIIAQIGVLKAGACYLPIDCELPDKRRTLMLDDSKVRVVVLSTKVNMFGPNITEIGIKDLEDKGTIDSYPNINSPSDGAYIIYTSGSTGKPKGVLISHGAVVNYSLGIKCFPNYSDVNDEKIISVTAVSFDIFVTESILPMINGKTTIIISKEESDNPQKVGEIVTSRQADLIQTTPSKMRLLVEEGDIRSLSSIKMILLGGEALPLNLYRDLRQKTRAKIVNAYGPTETTVWSTRAEIINNIITIGKPIANTQIYIIDRFMKLLPKGCAGELCIAGDGLAKGYLNQPELTAEKFVPNPFQEGTRMYRTGDLGKWLPDGNIEFIGRIDHQVKIRGYRIELGEIENKLLEHFLINEAIVIAKDDEFGSKYLCAYISTEEELKTTEIREHLMSNLPDYMVPTFFVQLKRLPLNSNGKIDRKALPEPNRDCGSTKVKEHPQNEIESRLLEIWEEVLQTNDIGTNENFFELGGHSLKAIIIAARVLKEFKRELPVREIFQSPTVKQLAQFLRNAEEQMDAAIAPAQARAYYPLSSTQKRIYALNQISEANISYNMPAQLIIDGDLDKIKLEDSFNKLIQRHETLRTSFVKVDGEVFQKVNADVDFSIEERECAKESEELRRVVQDFVVPFELEKAPLMRCCLIRKAEKKSVLLFDMYHIISDGTSMGILMKELTQLYAGSVLPELKIQFKDFAVWEQENEEEKTEEKLKKYWRERLAGEIPVLTMPTDYPRQLTRDYIGRTISFMGKNELANSINQMAKKNGLTTYMIYLATFNILLAKCTGQNDICVGTPVAGRKHLELQGVIGMFVNTLVMRNTPKSEGSFLDFLNEVSQKTVMDFENQEYQFEDVVDLLGIKKELGRNPLFDVMLVLQNISKEQFHVDGLKITLDKLESGVSKFDLTLSIEEESDYVKFEIEYSTALFKEETIKRLGAHYIAILDQVTKKPEIKIGEIDMLSKDERQLVLQGFNQTSKEYPMGKTLGQLFEEQVEKTPNEIAVVYENQKLTYTELNEKANQLARTLRENGIKPNKVVGIMVERSLEMVIAMMGALKAGGVYLPIDIEYPEDRVAFMLKDSEARVLLVKEGIKFESNIKTTILKIQDRSVQSNDKSNLERNGSSNDRAYIIYTSGTTGKPKGVPIKHRNILNTLCWRKEYYGFDQTDAVLQIPFYGFDSSVEDIFTPLISGARLVLINQGKRLDGNYLKNVINKNQITNFLVTPAFYSMLLEEALVGNDTLRKITVAGENVPMELVRKHFEVRPNSRLFNEYGPTENSVCSTVFELERDCEKVLIGKPIANTKAYILDDSLNVQPVGVWGELCLSGVGLSEGYLNRPDLTAEKFIENPLEQGTKLYKTGDLARWNIDGNIEFSGRLDHQVKIRGYRIELGEIEEQILEVDGIQEALVLVKEAEGKGKYLSAYYVAEKDQTMGIKEHLEKTIPHYMVPSSFVHLDKMPLTQNGKVDREKLQMMTTASYDVEYEAPTTAAELKLVDIWKDLLNVETVGKNHHFFDLGGHSLKAMQLMSRIQKELDFEMPLKEIFSRSTIAEMADYISNGKKSQGEFYTEQHYSILNGENQKKIFAFPPIVGSSISFNKLAEQMGEHAFYSFDFIQGENIIERYAKLVEQAQPEGALQLLGYSAGGNLAFEIAKELESRGRTISSIILVDSYQRLQALKNVEEVTAETVKTIILDFFPEYAAHSEGDEQFLRIVEVITGKMRSYYSWFNSIVNYGMVSADIHLIKSDERLEENTEECWENATKGSLMAHKGVGKHEKMLWSEEALTHNVGLIKDILCATK